ncbi:MAG: mycofactocin biosynthesis chaperone MftB [Microthrixaceae bacterium]|nr:mycofactocin biosynthesis chaperone MftB [Microthrixaceae bacterium]
MDLQQRYRLHPQVALRPEPFGALAYHFGNRRLSFLRSPEILAVVEGLDDATSVAAALEAAEIDAGRWAAFERALATLEESEMIIAVAGESGCAA